MSRNTLALGRLLGLSLVSLVAQAQLQAETVIDDFSTPHPAFGEAFLGHTVFDVPISGSGIATSRDGHGQASPFGSMTTPPGSVTGGEFVINQMGGPFHYLFMVYDAHGDAAVGSMPTMPGGPFDMSAVTEFRIDVSGLTGSLTWYIILGDTSGQVGSSSSPLVNGVNSISATTSPLPFIDFSQVTNIGFGVISTAGGPNSARIDNFRIDADLVPEPNTLLLLLAGSLAGALARRRTVR